MRKIKIAYWIITVLFAAFMLFSSFGEITNSKQATDFIVMLGYPAYLVPFLGVAKLLGVIAILVPGFPRLREWAYAGFVIDLVGATYSFIALGYPVNKWIFMLVFIFFTFCSYFLYHKIRKGTVPNN